MRKFASVNYWILELFNQQFVQNAQQRATDEGGVRADSKIIIIIGENKLGQ